jgi:hypothetical protein
MIHKQTKPSFIAQLLPIRLICNAIDSQPAARFDHQIGNDRHCPTPDPTTQTTSPSPNGDMVLCANGQLPQLSYRDTLMSFT